MFSLDLQISQFLFQIGRALPRELVVFGATYLIWALIVLEFFASRVLSARWIKLFSQAMFAGAAAYVANAVIGFFIFLHARPFAGLGFNPLIDVGPFSKSFPSDHTAVAFALACVVFLKNKKAGAVFLLIAFLISVSRILAGVHYASDVLAGAFIGIMCAWLVFRRTKGLYHVKDIVKNF